MLALLRARNRAAAPALAVTKAATTLLTECTALEKQLDRERQATDLLVKERHEMVADMELLRQNEANGGVSREHIEQLRDLLEKSKTEAARSASEAAAARASDTSTSEAAQLMAGKLAEAQARAADLEHSLKIAAAREQSLESENARLIERLTVQLQAQAMAMDSERLESGRPCSGCASCAGQSDVHVWCAGDADVHRCPRERTRPCAEHTRTREPRTLASTLTVLTVGDAPRVSQRHTPFTHGAAPAHGARCDWWSPGSLVVPCSQQGAFANCHCLPPPPPPPPIPEFQGALQQSRPPPEAWQRCQGIPQRPTFGSPP